MAFSFSVIISCGGGGGGGGGTTDGGLINNQDVNLSSLTISDGVLVFSPATTAYNVEVVNGTTAVTVTPTASDGTSVIKVNGSTVSSGSASQSINLVVGQNTITILVTSADGSASKTYTVVVTRLSGLSNNADLSGLGLSVGTLSPAFTANTTDYTAEVAWTVSSITVTPTAAGINATIKVETVAVNSGYESQSINLNHGSNDIEIVVTAEDSTTKTYTVTVTRLPEPSHNADLSGLVLSSGTLSPLFDDDTVSYTADVAYSVSSITVTPTAAGVGATITVNGTAVTSGTASGSITLNQGNNTITIKVTAEDGTTTKTYTVVVTRADPPSDNAFLSGLTLSHGSLSPVFNQNTYSYTSQVVNAIGSITVTPTAAGVGATITVNGTAVTSGSASGSITLNQGNNTITVVVTAEDTTTIKTYTVTVNRLAGPTIFVGGAYYIGNGENDARACYWINSTPIDLGESISTQVNDLLFNNGTVHLVGCNYGVTPATDTALYWKDDGTTIQRIVLTADTNGTNVNNIVLFNGHIYIFGTRHDGTNSYPVYWVDPTSSSHEAKKINNETNNCAEGSINGFVANISGNNRIYISGSAYNVTYSTMIATCWVVVPILDDSNYAAKYDLETVYSHSYGEVYVYDDTVYVGGELNGDYACYWKASAIDGSGKTKIDLETTTESFVESIFANGTVYAAGSFLNGGVDNACYWVDNGTTVNRTDLDTNESASYKITVVGSDVYNAGYFVDSVTKACYWKNSLKTELSPPTGYGSYDRAAISIYIVP